MTFSLKPDLIGCGQKLPLGLIKSISAKTGLRFGADAEALDWRGATLFSSIDRLGRFCEDFDLFATMAVLHFSGDIIVSRARPLQISFCLEFGPEFENSSQFTRFTSSVVTAIRERQISVGNIHSVRSDYTAITACTIGAGGSSFYCTPVAGKIFISDKIGFFKKLIIQELDGEIFEGASLLGNRVFLDELPEAACAASDVTGFGLRGALMNLAHRHCLAIEASVTSTMAFHHDVLTVPIACLERSGSCDASIEPTSANVRLSNLSEVAGPFVVLCNDDEEVAFVSWFKHKAGQLPLEIGRFSLASEPSVRISCE